MRTPATRRTLLIVAALVAGVAAGAASQTKETLEGASNYTRVDATVACGGATSPAAFPELKARGFTAVINLRLASEPGADIDASRQAAEGAGLKYVHIPFDGRNPSAPAVDTFLTAMRDPSISPVYIHCASANRVGAVWLAKRVLVDGWDVERATREAELIGLSSTPLKNFMLDYVKTHKG